MYTAAVAITPYALCPPYMGMRLNLPALRKKQRPSWNVFIRRGFLVPDHPRTRYHNSRLLNTSARALLFLQLIYALLWDWEEFLLLLTARTRM
jgi:hypothetical protein